MILLKKEELKRAGVNDCHAHILVHGRKGQYISSVRSKHEFEYYKQKLQAGEAWPIDADLLEYIKEHYPEELI